MSTHNVLYEYTDSHEMFTNMFTVPYFWGGGGVFFLKFERLM